MQRMEQVSEFKEKLVAVNRVTKVVKGGRNFRFSALVVVGDEKGRVGAGMGKAAEISEAIRKGTEDAKKHLINVPVLGTSIPHESIGRFGTGKVVLLPAPEGTGGRRRRCPRRAGAGGCEGYPHQELWHQQQDQHGQGHSGRPEAAALR